MRMENSEMAAQEESYSSSSSSSTSSSSSSSSSSEEESGEEKTVPASNGTGEEDVGLKSRKQEGDTELYRCDEDGETEAKVVEEDVASKRVQEMEEEMADLRDRLAKADAKVESKEKYIEDLIKQVKDMCEKKAADDKKTRKLHKMTQTDESRVNDDASAAWYQHYAAAYAMPVPAVPAVPAAPTEWDSADTGKSIAEQVKDTAEQACWQSGFVYDDTSGMYYDYSTGYYYDAEHGLYYDSYSGTYYYFDAESNAYKVYSQVPGMPSIAHPPPVTNAQPPIPESVKSEAPPGEDEKPPPPKEPPPSDDKKLAPLPPADKDEEKPDVKEENGELSDGEVVSGDDEDEEEEEKEEGEEKEEEGEGGRDRREKKRAKKERRKRRKQKEKEAMIDETDPRNWAPCVRIIVKDTRLPSLKVGSLFLVTCSGGVLGRAEDSAVYLPDEFLSKAHAKISYSNGKYLLTDLGSCNGTFLNNHRLSEKKKVSVPEEIVHASTLRVGRTTMVCHIHKGIHTCGHCEPGLIQTTNPVETTEHGEAPDQASHRNVLKRIRKKYALESTEPNLETTDNPDYSDRATKRRKTVGSEDPFLASQTETTSVEDPIRADNKGFKMLSKMGWKEGEALGGSQVGIQEPIALEGQVDRLGLGATKIPEPSKKEQIRLKTQERFQQIS